MTTEILDDKVLQPSGDLKTTGVFNLSRGLTQDEYTFLQTGIKNKFKRALLIRNGPWFDGIIKRSESSEDLLNILSFTSYVGRTFIKIDGKGVSTPEQATSAIKGLEELFLLPVFSRSEKPIQIAFGSATFRIGETEFYKATYRDGQPEVQSGMLAPVWNQPVTVG